MDAEEFNELQRLRAVKRWGRVRNKELAYIKENREKTLHLKALINGYLCGDGCVSIRKEHKTGKKHAEIKFYPDHYSMVVSFSKAFADVYGKKASVRKLKGHYRVRVSSSVCAEDLLRDGSLSSLEWRVPDWVICNPENSREWLRAFFDSEAYVGKKRICVQSVNRHGLIQVKEMLKGFGVEVREYTYVRKNINHNINYHITVLKRESRYNFLKRIGLNHKKKLKKLVEQFAGVA